MNVSGLATITSSRSPLRHERLGRRRLPLEAMPFGQHVDDLESDVVPGARVPASRVCRDRRSVSSGDLQAFLNARGAPPPLARARRLRASREPQALLFFLVGLALLDDLGLGRRRWRSLGCRRRRRSSALSATTCTIIMSGSLIGFHFASSVCRSRTRTPWFNISSQTSTVMFSGMSPGSTSISISRLTKSTMPPCCLTPRASPLRTIGTVTVSILSIATW